MEERKEPRKEGGKEGTKGKTNAQPNITNICLHAKDFHAGV
jgi:hypothetical protein